MLAVLLLMALLSVAPALAEPAPLFPPERGRSDAATYAAAFAVPFAEAQRRLALQAVAGEVEVKLRAMAADIFGGLWLIHTPRLVAQVRFTEPALGAAILAEMFGGLGLEFEILPAAASLTELEDLQRAVLRRLREAGVAADVDLDVRLQVVQVETAAPSPAGRALGGLPEASRRILAIVPVAALAGPQGKPDLLPLRGGRPMSSCTTAFPARDARGRTGVLSAGHCPEMQIYRDYELQLPWAGALFAGGRDVAFFESDPALAATGEFDSGIGLRRVAGARGRDHQALGSLVCRHGMTTSYRCGTLTSRHLCPAYVAGCTPTFLRVHSLDGQPLAGYGDSGGPWFLEAVAYGIHSGHFESSPDAVYMAIDLAAPLAVLLIAP